MRKITITTTTLDMSGQDLSPFYAVAEAINQLGGKFNVYRVSEKNPVAKVEHVHTFKNLTATVAGNVFVVEEAAAKKRGQFNGIRAYMCNFDGYEIVPSGAILRNPFTKTKIYFEKCA
jgi:hypothetical protein